jgi:uncharacterized protein
LNVFVDTSAFYALLSRTDANHADAANRWQVYLGDRTAKLFTSNYVVVEACALLTRRLGKPAVADLHQSLLPATTVLRVDESTHHAAMEATLATGNDGPSLVDCSSLALMRARGIDAAFAYDRHFPLPRAV